MRKITGAIIRARNVNEALPLGMFMIQQRGEKTSSRGLNTIRVPGVVSTIYSHPMERVLFDPVRDANPFFHLIESLWILSGSNTVALPYMFLPRITQYSDDGEVFHGAYGHRLRKHFGFDQIKSACAQLAAKPDSRQTVMAIWDPVKDLNATTKDMPCNDLVMLDIVEDKLNITVCNRSNDAILGAYGANVVQFSMLQEWMAASIGVEVGTYTQQSNNYHVYEDNPFWLKFQQGEYEHGHVHNPYTVSTVSPSRIAWNPREAHQVMLDCEQLNATAETGMPLLPSVYQSAFFVDVVTPAIRGYYHYKNYDFKGSFDALSEVLAEDWRRAMVEWVKRREDKRRQA